MRKDGLLLRVGSAEWRFWHANHLRMQGHKIKSTHPARRAVIREALSLVGITEEPKGSNDGTLVREIQSATRAYRAPWCVSTVQRIWVTTVHSTWADDTANAYYLADYAKRHSAVIDKPLPGCAVVYHIGDGHAGTVVNVLRNGDFYAVEGNWGDAVARIKRDPRTIPCTFILRPELR